MEEMPLAHMTYQIMSRDPLQAPMPLADKTTVAWQIYNPMLLTEVSRCGITADYLSARSPTGVGVLTRSVKIAGMFLVNIDGKFSELPYKENSSETYT